MHSAEAAANIVQYFPVDTSILQLSSNFKRSTYTVVAVQIY
jgi:hypothetical protein